jgi:type IV secretion system protein VirB1
VAPQTVAAIVKTESGGNPFAVYVNKARQPQRATNAAEAVATAQRYVVAGYSVDMGLGQINSRNMDRLGLRWDTVFKPCANIAALGKIISRNYHSAAAGRQPQEALRIALSAYNTGSPSKGFRNGYVAKVVGNAGVGDGLAPIYLQPLPIMIASTSPTSMSIDQRSAIAAENVVERHVIAQTAPHAPAPPAWNVFARAAYDRASYDHASDDPTGHQSIINHEGEMQ